MYQVGERIVYGETGVCEVMEISERAVASGEKKLCYTLQPLYQSGTISTPVDNVRVFMRPVISREEAKQLIDLIPSMPAKIFHSRVQREVVAHYEGVMRSHNCRDLLELTKSIHTKQRQDRAQNRRVSSVDERFLRRAENLLFGELATALGISRDSVEGYIAAAVEKQD